MGHADEYLAAQGFEKIESWRRRRQQDIDMGNSTEKMHKSAFHKQLTSPDGLKYIDQLMSTAQFEMAHEQVNEFLTDKRGHLQSGPNESLTLRRLEASLALGLRVESSLHCIGEIRPEQACSLDKTEQLRLRLAQIFGAVIDERYEDVVQDYEQCGVLSTAPELHQHAIDFCLWMLMERNSAPDFSPAATDQVPSPIAAYFGAYLRLVSIRVIQTQYIHGVTLGKSPVDRFEELEVPPGSDFLAGEYLDLEGLLKPEALIRMVKCTSFEDAPRGYSSLCLRARLAIINLTRGNLAITASMLANVGMESSWALPICSRMSLARIGISLARNSIDDVQAGLLKVDGAGPRKVSRISTDVVEIFKAGLLVSSFGSYDQKRLHLICKLLISTDEIALAACPVVMEHAVYLLENLVDNGLLREAGTLIDAVDYRSGIDGRILSIHLEEQLISVASTWALCSRKSVPLSMSAAPEGQGETRRDLLNKAHRLYESSKIDSASDILGRIFEPFDAVASPLDWQRYGLLRTLTSRTQESFDFDSLVLAITPPIASALLPLFFGLTRLLAEQGNYASAQRLLEAILKHLPQKSHEAELCRFYIADCYEATAQHWKAASLFSDLSRRHFSTITADGSIEGLPRYRQAKNLYLDFKHERASVLFEALLNATFALTASGLDNRLKLLRMASLSYEMLGQFSDAEAAWKEIATLLSEHHVRNEELAYACYRIGVLNFRSETYLEAEKFFRLAHRAYRETFGPNNSLTLQVSRRIGSVEMRLGRQTTLGGTYQLSEASADVRRQEEEYKSIMI
ncbi:tetratricopeptide repeat protein [Arthrobacter sp. Z1-15]